MRALLELLDNDETERPAPPSEWMRVDEVPLPRRRLLARARAGEIESVRDGRTVLLRRVSVDAYLARHTRARPAEAPVADLDPEAAVRAALGLVAVSPRRRSA